MRFQPDIAKYSQEILPILFDHMSKAAENIDKEAKSVSKIYYALEMFCENLGKYNNIKLMEHLNSQI